MSTSRFRLRICNLNFSPFVNKRIKFMDIANILLISSAENIEFTLVCSGCMSPSSGRSSFSNINSSYMDPWLYILRLIQKRSHVKYMHFIEMSILTVTTSKAHNLGIIDRVNCVKPFSCVEIFELKLRFIPNLTLKIKSPKVFLIRISFSSNSDHVLLMQTWSVISSSCRHRRKLFQD